MSLKKNSIQDIEQMKKPTNKEIEEIWLDVTSAKTMRGNFRTKHEFISWIEFKRIDDLYLLLDKFIEAEMFEDCALIRDMINKKKLNKLMK